ncbi:MAG: alpha amylase C-terminal domain-containing protein [Dysgonamonadaceae bacterium]|jgi:glycosidase|nr:alpha amylase C-terminal domain-containing protein [Dysgonamonadaceae bacterium]
MKVIVKVFLIGVVCAACSCFVSCGDNGDDPDPVNPGTSDNLPITVNNRVIYEVNVRNFSLQGNFAGVEAALPRLRELGVDILWLMPIHPIGEKNKGGTKGSPYSVRDYLKINPDFGTESDLKSLIAAAHKAKMDVYLDWVGNHTSWDHVWVSEHIDYYASKNGQRPYSPEGWNDVVQLDYSNQNMRAAMIDALKYWVREFDIDGYRCDYAIGVPLDFWTKARAEVDAIKKIGWLEEGENTNYLAAFDYDYAWNFNDRLNDFGKDSDIAQFKAACNALFSNSKYADKGRMIYLTNHDLEAYDGTVFERYGDKVIPLTVLYFAIHDMPLIYNGQEVGANKRTDLFNVSLIPWTPVNPTLSVLFKKLTKLKHTQPALESGKNRGTLSYYETDNDKVLVFARKRGNNEVIVMLNFSPAPGTFHFTGTAPAGEFTNYLGSGKQSFNTANVVSLAANGYAVYVKE